MSSKEAAEAETFRVDELKNHYPSSFTIQQISNSVTVRECMPWTMILIYLEDNQIQICHRIAAGIWFPQKPFLTIWLLSRESVFRASSSATCFSWLPGNLQDPVSPPSFLLSRDLLWFYQYCSALLDSTVSGKMVVNTIKWTSLQDKILFQRRWTFHFLRLDLDGRMGHEILSINIYFHVLINTLYRQCLY